MSAIAIILIKLFIHSAMAASTEVPIMPGDRIVIKGLEAQVSLISTGGNSLKISGVDESGAVGSYSLVRKDNIFEIHMNEYSSQKSWMEILPKANSVTKKIEISGVSVPVEVHLRGGVVVAQKWQKELKISMTEGRANSTGGMGEIQAFIQKGDISVSDHNGKVTADSFSGSVYLKNISGDVEASLFMGQLVVDKAKGFINIATPQSSGKILQSVGTVQFENGKGNLAIQNFQGRIEGNVTDGSVAISVGADSEVDVKSKSGKVSIQIPSDIGAAINLLTLEGEIIVPPEMKVTKVGTEKSVRGKLRGDAQKVSVIVRSQDGLISVK